MERISNSTFRLLLQLAAAKSMEADVELFDSLDTSEITISEKVERRILRAIRRDKTAPVRRKWLTALQRAAAVVLIVTTTFFAAAMCIEPVRAAFIHAIVTWYEDYVSIWFGEKEEDAPTTIEEVYTIANLPEGWIMEKFGEDNTSVVHMLLGPDGENVFFQQSVQLGNDHWVDNTNCEEIHIKLQNETPAVLYEYEDGSVYLIWNDTYVFFMNGINTSPEMLIHLANSIAN